MGEVKQGRGRPRKPAAERTVQLSSSVQPSTHDAYKSDGRTVDQIMRAGLGLS